MVPEEAVVVEVVVVYVVDEIQGMVVVLIVVTLGNALTVTATTIQLIFVGIFMVNPLVCQPCLLFG